MNKLKQLKTKKPEPHRTLKEADSGEFPGLNLDKTMTEKMDSKMRTAQLLLARVSLKIFPSCNILSSFGQIALLFSICPLEKAVSLHGLCPSGVVNRNVPSSIFSEAHISSCGSGLDMGAFNRPRELARTCSCFLEYSCISCQCFLPGCQAAINTERRFICSRGEITSVKPTSVALAVVVLMQLLIPSCQYLGICWKAPGSSILWKYLWLLYVGCQRG